MREQGLSFLQESRVAYRRGEQKARTKSQKQRMITYFRHRFDSKQPARHQSPTGELELRGERLGLVLVALWLLCD